MRCPPIASALAVSGSRATIAAPLRYPAPFVHAWLVRLTQPEDSILWIWVAIALLYTVVGAVVGALRGLRTCRAGASRSEPGPP